jgi:CheY-like chemotaxis protein
VHWRAEEARDRIEQLQAAGYEVEFDALAPALMRGMRERPPSAVVIDLTRLPSHGREVATALRGQKSTRMIPLVFIGGEPEKVEKLRAVIPDAAFTDWSRFRAGLKKAIAHPPAAPHVPVAMMERYGDTPLVKKLGIKAGMRVAVIEAPDEFERTLGDLPENVALEQRLGRGCQMALWFVRSSRDLEARIGRLGATTPPGGVWIVYPKKTSGLATDLTQQMVRETGLAHGLVDFKVCAVDDTWTGLKFSRRKEKR